MNPSFESALEMDFDTLHTLRESQCNSASNVLISTQLQPWDRSVAV
jgi:hypothetical protein